MSVGGKSRFSHRQSTYEKVEATRTRTHTLSFVVHLSCLFSGNTIISSSVTLPILLELCFAAGTGEDRGGCGMLQLGKGKLENEKGSSARAAAKLFKAIFSTGLIIPPCGVGTPTRSKVCISLLQGAAY